MERWLPTPVDKVGMPLPIAPQVEFFPTDNPEVANWHHHFHPRTDPILNTIGGKALRSSRLQLVDIWQHNQGNRTYHNFYSGPPLPEDEAEQFKLCVLACAGYLPEEGIDLSSGEPKIIRLTEEQKKHFMVRGEPDILPGKQVVKWRIRHGFLGMSNSEAKRRFAAESEKQAELTYRHLTYGYDPIRAFFEHYTAKQPIGVLYEKTADEFLHTLNPDRKLFLGHWLLAKAVEIATDSLERTYVEVQSEALLHPAMPSRPQTLVKDKLGRPERRWERVIPLLEANLRVAA